MKLLLQLILSIWYNINNGNSIVIIDNIINRINEYCSSSSIDIIELELILLCIDDNDDDIISFSTTLSSISPSLSLLSSFISLLKSSLSSLSSSVVIKVIYKRPIITSILNTNSVYKLPWLIINDNSNDLISLSNNYIDVNVADNSNVDIDNMFTKAIENYNNFELMKALQVFDEILNIDNKHKGIYIYLYDSIQYYSLTIINII